MEWTVEKVSSLAPDTGAEQRGRALADAGKWNSIGKADTVLWGECKGSGSEPYRTHIDLLELGFGCTCPTRKHPCKHALGLLFMLSQSPDTIPVAVAAVPAWVEQWVAKRRTKSKQSQTATDQPAEVDTAEKQKRQSQKEEQVEGALAVLEQWLMDVVRTGVAQLPVQDPDFWDRLAAQLADAGLSRLRQSVKMTAAYIAQHTEWVAYLLERLGEWYGLISAFRRRRQLPPLLVEDVWNALGRTIFKKDVIAQGQQLSDEWYVLGQYEGMNIDKIPFRQVWLYGQHTGRYAMLLDYKFGDQAYEHTFVQDSVLVGSLAFYPSQFPQRAVAHHFHLIESRLRQWKGGFDNFAALQQGYAGALGLNPWMEDFPAILLSVVPILQGGALYLMDTAQRLLRVNIFFEDAFWQLMASSAGTPITVFVTFDGKEVDVFSIWTSGSWMGLVGAS